MMGCVQGYEIIEFVEESIGSESEGNGRCC